MPRTSIHPGEILTDELKIAAAITADTALRLARWFGTSAELWMNLQQTYELDLARQKLGDAIARLPTRDVAAPAAST